MPKKNSSLGRGLGSLIAKGSIKSFDSAKKANVQKKPLKIDVAPPTEEVASSPYIEIPLKLIDRSPYQPRMEFREEDLKELSASIAAEGLLQPIVVRKQGIRYQLIAGERRLRACQMLNFEKIPVRIVKANDASSAVIALIENLQRENLNPIDESMGYASLMRDFDLTQEEVAQRVGKARATVANSLRLIQLEQEIQGYLSKGMISMGHAKVLLSLENSPQRMLLARRIIEEGLNVRQAEQIVQQLKRKNGVHSLSTPITNVQTAVIKDLQKQLSAHFNAKVVLQHGTKKGKLVINYQGNEDLHRVLEKIGFMKSKTQTAA